MSILTVHYQSGEKRIINLHPAFFSSEQSEAFNKKTHRVEKRVLTPTEKASILAETLSPYPYIIQLERGGKLLLKKIVLENFPKKVSKEEKVNEYDIKRKLRREHKHTPLTRLTVN